ncbi:hypothetical protein HPB51_023862 [Rhipicephalus microplus]|uniref:F-box domain-containing protein n=1 Tax=Rhipicephalus microplus TaxID=6941 RepID=A0A9J6F830_RHIMP|nr:hypothetical protein HPB51_023862 [Rhipicephalus microplus]
MSVGWAHGNFAALPSVVLVEIYEYLSFRDKLKASSTCRAWRDCLFHPRFWTTLTIRLGRKRNAWRQAEFLAKKCGRFVRHFTLEFDCTSPQIVQQCIAVLALLGENRQLTSLCLRPTACVVAWPHRLYDAPNVQAMKAKPSLSTTDDQQTVCEGSWLELSRRCPKLRVTIALLHTCEPWSAIKGLLNAAIPLAKFQSYFSDGFRSDVLDLLSAQYAETLEAVTVVSALSGIEGIPQRTFAVRAESPVVMLAWRCHRLRSLKLVGHEIADFDLIAVARLRGPQLKELVIPADCVSGSSIGGPYYSELRLADVEHLETEVSLSLQRTWTLTNRQSPAQNEMGEIRSYMRSIQELQSYTSL